jgi:hypothetical protein
MMGMRTEKARDIEPGASAENDLDEMVLVSLRRTLRALPSSGSATITVIHGLLQS